MSTGMVVQSSNGHGGNGSANGNGNGSNNGMSVYDRIQDPLAFVTEMGKVFWQSGAAGAKTEAEGKLLALACMCEKKNPFEINRVYHLMEGKLSMRADAMLAECRARGGKHRWIETGDDGKAASMELTYDGQTTTVRFTFEDAKRMKIVRDGSGWTKNPDAMLRARVISKAIRMLAPEIVAGCYTPEEIEDSVGDTRAAPRMNEADVAARRAELLAMQSQPVASTEPAAQVIDAVVETKSETPPFDGGTVVVAPEVESTPYQQSVVLMEIESLCGQLGITKDQLNTSIRAQHPDFTSIDDFPEEKARQLLGNLRAKVEGAPKK